MVGKSFLMGVFLMFCTSDFSLWGVRLDEGEVGGDEQSQAIFFENLVKVMIDVVNGKLSCFVHRLNSFVPGSMEDLREEDRWASCLEEFDRMRAIYMRCAKEIAALKSFAVAGRDAILQGIRMSDGETTDLSTETWEYLGNVRRQGLRLWWTQL
jgi:hypothetical protein